MEKKTQAIPSAVKKALVQTNAVTIAKALMTPVGPERVALPGVTGSQPLPQPGHREDEREENAGNPIGGEIALAQTDVTAQVTALRQQR
jgi:hypothetical protein